MKRMQMLLLLAFLTGAVQAFAQPNAIDKYFSQYVEDSRFSVIYISPRLISMFKDMNVGSMDDKETAVLLDIAKDLKGLRILSTDITPEKFYKEAREKINTKEYEVLMTIRDKDGDNVDFLIKENADKKVEELLLLASGDDFLLMSFVGNIDLDKVSKLADEMKKDDPEKDKND